METRYTLTLCSARDAVSNNYCRLRLGLLALHSLSPDSSSGHHCHGSASRSTNRVSAIVEVKVRE